MGHAFTSLNEAARSLLVEACSILNKSEVESVVAGGWVPVLRVANHASLQHPGTRDVDILFNDDPKTIEASVRIFLENGFLLSAKHEFQLLKPFRVDTQEFVFNVDSMHPGESSKKPEMFRDILDLGIRSDYDPTSPKVKSICFPSSSIIFEQHLWSDLRIPAVDFRGEPFETDVPLMNEAALILSKADSVKQAKRTRDAYDIYFLLSSQEGHTVAEDLKRLSTSFPQVATQIGLLQNFLSENPDRFDQNVSAHLGDSSVSSQPSEFVRALLFS